MYFQSDYILRMIEMMGGLLKRILGFTAEAKLDDAKDELDKAWRRFIGISRANAGSISVSQLIALCDGSERQARLYSLTKLCCLEIIVATEELDEETCDAWREKLIFAAMEIDIGTIQAKDAADDVINAEAALRGRLSQKQLVRLARWMCRAGRLDAAENYYFFLGSTYTHEIEDFVTYLESLGEKGLAGSGLTPEDAALARQKLQLLKNRVD